MKIPWSLKGALLHHLCVSMCVAPSMHSLLTVAERCEVALSGYICMDLFSMLAKEKCRTLQLPGGSTFMAVQTCSTLQHVALSVVLICLTMEDGFDAWTSGTARLTELPIEYHFGYLRCMMSNSQFSARQFFACDAKQAAKTGKALNNCRRTKQIHPRPEKKLSDEEPLERISLFQVFLLLFVCSLPSQLFRRDFYKMTGY